MTLNSQELLSLMLAHLPSPTLKNHLSIFNFQRKTLLHVTTSEKPSDGCANAPNQISPLDMSNRPNDYSITHNITSINNMSIYYKY